MRLPKWAFARCPFPPSNLRGAHAGGPARFEAWHWRERDKCTRGRACVQVPIRRVRAGVRSCGAIIFPWRVIEPGYEVSAAHAMRSCHEVGAAAHALTVVAGVHFRLCRAHAHFRIRLPSQEHTSTSRWHTNRILHAHKNHCLAEETICNTSTSLYTRITQFSLAFCCPPFVFRRLFLSCRW